MKKFDKPDVLVGHLIRLTVLAGVDFRRFDRFVKQLTTQLSDQ